MRDRQGFILVYDITNPLSLTDLNEIYTQIMRNHLSSTPRLEPEEPSSQSAIPLVLVGNKLDLAFERKISRQRGKELAELWKCPHYETSARTRLNVDVIFHELVRQIVILQKEDGQKNEASQDLLSSGKEVDDDMAPTGCCVVV